MTTLHDQVKAEIQRRLALAQAAQQPSDAVHMSIWEDGFTKVRQGLEAEIARQCEAALRMLERHRPREFHTPDVDMVICDCCGWDLNANGDGEPTDTCPDIRDLADSYGIPIDNQEQT